MPVQIDEFHTEVELTPSKREGQPAPAAQAPVQTMDAKLDPRGLLAYLEGELDSYMRRRG